MKIWKILFLTFLASTFACIPGSQQEKAWLSRQLNPKTESICHNVFKLETPDLESREKESKVETLSGYQGFLGIDFVVPSNSMLRKKPRTAKRLISTELYLKEKMLGWMFVDTHGCVEYVEVNKINWSEWFKPQGLGATLNKIYYSATGEEPRVFPKAAGKKAKKSKQYYYATQYQWGATVRDIVRISLRQDIKFAFDLIEAVAQRKSSVLANGYLKIPSKKKFKLQFILRDDPFLDAKVVRKQIRKRKLSYRPKSFDAITVILDSPKSRKQEIISNIVMDKMLRNLKTGTLYDSNIYIPRLAVAIAHQLYGPVEESLLMNIQESKAKGKRRVIREDVKGIREGMSFVKRLMRTDQFNKLSPQMQEEFRKILKAESKNFRKWRRAMKAKKNKTYAKNRLSGNSSSE